MLKPSLPLILVLALPIASTAADRDDWQSLAQLRPNDQVRVSQKARPPLIAQFQSWTPEQLTAGSVSAKREDVLKVERYRPHTWSRGRKAALGALIGFGGGFAIGAAAPACDKHSFGPCFTRAETGVVVAVVGAAVGGIVGALLPHHATELIYAAKRTP